MGCADRAERHGQFALRGIADGLAEGGDQRKKRPQPMRTVHRALLVTPRRNNRAGPGVALPLPIEHKIKIIRAPHTKSAGDAEVASVSDFAGPPPRLRPKSRLATAEFPVRQRRAL